MSVILLNMYTCLASTLLAIKPQKAHNTSDMYDFQLMVELCLKKAQTELIQL